MEKRRIGARTKTLRHSTVAKPADIQPFTHSLIRSIYLPLALATLFLAFSCSLEEEVLDESSGENLLEEPGIEMSLLAPVYSQLKTVIASTESNLWALSEASSDEVVVPTRGLDWEDEGKWKQLHRHSWDAASGPILGLWTALETGVSRANTGLLLLESLEGKRNPALTRALRAELRLLRALYCYWQYDCFRQIPVRDIEDEDYLTPPPVLKNQEAFEWLESELLAILPDMKPMVEQNYGRVTDDAARFLLAKLYLNAAVYTGQPAWEQCLEQCAAIINTGWYQLADDYFHLFSVDNEVDNTEAIFVLRGSSQQSLELFLGAAVTLHRNQRLGTSLWTFNGYCTVPDFFYTWDQGDARFQDDRIRAATGANLGFLVGPQYHPDGSPVLTTGGEPLAYTVEVDLYNAMEWEGVRVLKYEPDPASGNLYFLGRCDFLLFRFADLHLMKTEVLLRLGRPQEALALANELREKRGVSGLNELTEDALLKERGFELYWEGWRRQDLIRFGRFAAGAWKDKQPVPEYRNVFPVPQTALDVNPNLEQNPGY